MANHAEIYLSRLEIHNNRQHLFTETKCSWCLKPIFHKPRIDGYRPIVCPDCAPSILLVLFFPIKFYTSIPKPRGVYCREAIRQFAHYLLLPETIGLPLKQFSIYIPKKAYQFLKTNYGKPSVAIRGCILNALLNDGLISPTD